MNDSKTQIIGVAWFRQNQWQELLKYCEDRENLEATYEIWKEGAEKAIKDLRSRGVTIHAVDFDLGEFMKWCREQTKLLNAESRAEFTSLKVRAFHRG